MRRLIIFFILFIGTFASLSARNVAMETKRKLPTKGTIEDAPILRSLHTNFISVFVDSNTVTIDFGGYEELVNVCIMNVTTGDIVFSDNAVMLDVLNVDLRFAEKGEYAVCLNSDSFVSFGIFSVDN